MQRITIETRIDAPAEVCFDCSRDIDLHVQSMSHTGERAVAGRTSGLIGAGEDVTWEGRHFGVKQRFTSRITVSDRPRHFQDSMVRGAFNSFEHDHYFEPDGEGTRMIDMLQFSAPLGPLGIVAEHLVLRTYLRRLLEERNRVIKTAAEASRTR